MLFRSQCGINNTGTLNTGDGMDRIVGIIRRSSSAYPLTLHGIRNAKTINTGAGADLIEGQGLEQNSYGITNLGVIDTAEGNDTITGSVNVVTGSASLYAGIMNYGTIFTGAGNDVITGYGFNPGTGIRNEGLIDTGSGDDAVSAPRGGLAGSGTIQLGDGNDLLNGFGPTTVLGGNGSDTLVFKPGRYTIKTAAARINGALAYQLSSPTYDTGNPGALMIVSGFEFFGTKGAPTSFAAALKAGSVTFI